LLRERIALYTRNNNICATYVQTALYFLSSLERLFFERICVCTGDDGEFYKAGVDGGRKGLRMGGREASFGGRPSTREKFVCTENYTCVDNIFAAKTRRATQQFRRILYRVMPTSQMSNGRGSLSYVYAQ